MKIRALEGYKDINIGWVKPGDEYEVTEARYNEMKRNFEGYKKNNPEIKPFFEKIEEEIKEKAEEVEVAIKKVVKEKAVKKTKKNV